MPGMHTIAVVWHYWIAVPLAVGVVVATVATVAAYLKKVQAPRYPSKRR
jgi:hypothetical protein